MPDNSTYNEKELLLQVADGDESAFSALFDIYRPNIYTTALRIIGNNWVAEEIVQDVFLKVWLKRHTLTAIDNFGGWVYTIAENLTFNAIKKQKSEQQKAQAVMGNAEATLYTDAESIVTEKEYQQLLEKAVKSLPQKQRQTYTLIRLQGMKREEVARELNVSPETVKSNLDQALRTIRAYCLARIDYKLLLGLFTFFLKK